MLDHNSNWPKTLPITTKIVKCKNTRKTHEHTGPHQEYCTQLRRKLHTIPLTGITSGFGFVYSQFLILYNSQSKNGGIAKRSSPRSQSSGLRGNHGVNLRFVRSSNLLAPEREVVMVGPAVPLDMVPVVGLHVATHATSKVCDYSRELSHRLAFAMTSGGPGDSNI